MYKSYDISLLSDSAWLSSEIVVRASVNATDRVRLLTEANGRSYLAALGYHSIAHGLYESDGLPVGSFHHAPGYA